MALNFPDSPSLGDYFSDGIRKWQYDGAKWVLVASDAITGATGATGPAGYHNAIINGGFDIWQRGVGAFTTANLYGADRWSVGATGTTFSTTREAFTLGNAITGYEPRYYWHTVVTSSAGAGNYCHFKQRLEDVRSFAGQTVTLSFWAKANASKYISVELVQYFGTGGTPSAAVVAPPVKRAITSSWVRYTFTVAVPSLNGKTIGTAGDDWLGVQIWLDAGSGFNSETDSLGQQSGTFDFWGVQLERGSVATDFEVLPIAQTLALCQRYYEKSYDMDTAPGTATIVGYYYGVGRGHSATSVDPGGYIPFKVAKRGLPTMTGYNAATGASGTWNFANQTVAPFFNGVGQTGFSIYSSANSGLTAGVAYIVAGHWTASAEL